MDTSQHMLCTKALSLKLHEMASLDFPAYGNIYFADAPIEDASLKIPLENGFCMAPIAIHCFGIVELVIQSYMVNRVQTAVHVSINTYLFTATFTKLG
jgi:hypothetical protein